MRALPLRAQTTVRSARLPYYRPGPEETRITTRRSFAGSPTDWQAVVNLVLIGIGERDWAPCEGVLAHQPGKGQQLSYVVDRAYPHKRCAGDPKVRAKPSGGNLVSVVTLPPLNAPECPLCEAGPTSSETPRSRPQVANADPPGHSLRWIRYIAPCRRT